MTEIFNKKELKERRRLLRNQATGTEKLLWERIRRKQILGVRFRRQAGIGAYVVDFYSPAIRLAIEIDGKSHDNTSALEYDLLREREIRQLGINVVRFRNSEVLNDLDSVLRRIEQAIATSQNKKTKGRTSLPLTKGEAEGVEHPSPLPRGKGRGSRQS